MTEPSGNTPHDNSPNHADRLAQVELERAEGALLPEDDPVPVMEEANAEPADGEEQRQMGATPAVTTAKCESTQSRGFLSKGLFDPTAEPPDERPIFEGFLSQDNVVVWVGREKHRKSNLTLQCAICAALGRNFLNFPFRAPGPVRVVLLDFESTNYRNTFWRRYGSICNALNLSEQDQLTLQANLQVILTRKLHKQAISIPRFPVRPKGKEIEAAKSWWKRFAREYPADLYIFDPMRCLHSEGENDSLIEALLSQLREFFPASAVIIPHHMRKSDKSANGTTTTLAKDMRGWSEDARGSTAIKAHADVIVCQERRMDGDVEVVYLGAFMKDAADVEPIALTESDHESFFWAISAQLPDKLRPAFEALRRANRPFRNDAEVAELLRTALSVSRSTAYRHTKSLRDGGFLTSTADGQVLLASEATVVPDPQKPGAEQTGLESLEGKRVLDTPVSYNLQADAFAGEQEGHSGEI